MIYTTWVTFQKGTFPRAKTVARDPRALREDGPQVLRVSFSDGTELGGHRISSALRSERVAKCSPRDSNVRGKTDSTYTKAPNIGC